MAATTTRIHVLNDIEQPTSNKVLMFLRPVETSDNFLFNAWQVLNPSYGTVQSVDLTTTYAASIAQFGDTRGSYTRPVSMPLGTALTISNLNDQSARITNEDGGRLTPKQIGLYNQALTPRTDVSVSWYVNNSRVVETNNTPTTVLRPNYTSTFELKQSVYLMFGPEPSDTETYTLQTFSRMVEIQVPNGASDLYIVAVVGSNGDTFEVTDEFPFQMREQQGIIRRQRAELRALEGPEALQLPVTGVTLAPTVGPNPFAGFVGSGHTYDDTNGNFVRLACGTFPYHGNMPVVYTPANPVRYTVTYNDAAGVHSRTLKCTQSEARSSFVA